MDWSIVLDYVLKIVGSITASIIITLAGLLYAKLQSKIKDSKITAYIKECVKAAEQLYPNLGMKTGTQKYKYVLECTMKKFPKVTDSDYLKSLIEGAVFALNNQLEEKKKDEPKNDSSNKTTNTNNTNKPLTSF